MGSSSSAEYKDLYALSDIAYVPNIQYVAEYIRVYSKDTEGPWNYYTLIKSHGSEYRGPHECQFPGVWRYLNTVWTKNPYTGNNWTVDEVNSLQAGLILSGLATVDRARCSQVYVSTLGVRFSAARVSRLLARYFEVLMTEQIDFRGPMERALLKIEAAVVKRSNPVCLRLMLRAP